MNILIDIKSRGCFFVKKIKIVMIMIIFFIIVSVGFIKVNMSNTTFYNYNKDKINSEEFKELIKEFDGSLEEQFSDNSIIKIYYNEEENLIADLGKYEMIILNKENWLDKFLKKSKMFFNELLSKITKNVEN